MAKTLLSLAALGLVICALGAAAPAHAEAQARSARAATPSAKSQTLVRAQHLSRQVLAALDEARRSRDPIQERCLDRTLAEVNALSRILGSERTAGGRHMRRRVEIVEERLSVLREQAAVCVGGHRADERRDGRTVVEVTVDPDVPHVDPTRIPEPPSRRPH